MYLISMLFIFPCTQEGCENPPSDSSISRLLRSDRGGSGGNGGGGGVGGRTSSHDDDGRKDYSIHGILGGGTRGKRSAIVFDTKFDFSCVRACAFENGNNSTHNKCGIVENMSPDKCALAESIVSPMRLV